MRNKILGSDLNSVLDLLKSCTQLKQLEKVHADICASALFSKNILVLNTLIDKFVKCGSLPIAQQVFNRLMTRDVISWNVLIAGYTKSDQNQDALYFLRRMRLESCLPNNVTYLCSLKACRNVGDIENGREIHSEVVNNHIFKTDIILGNAVIAMYANCGFLTSAHKSFEKLSPRDLVSWNTIITCYVKHGRHAEAWEIFRAMQNSDVRPNSVTFICILKACAGLEDITNGMEIHAQILNKGLLNENVIIGNALVDMYAKCGSMSKAQKVFEELPFKDVISWSTLIAGYVNHGQAQDGLQYFSRMQYMRVSPNAFTLSSILKACASTEDTMAGMQVHAEIHKKGLERDHIIGNALLDMYAKCGSVCEVQYIFKKLPFRDINSWNSLIGVYSECQCWDEMLNCSEEMQQVGIHPNHSTLSSILKACSSLGAIDKAIEIHCEIARCGYLETQQMIGNALVDVYAKNGNFQKAEDVFAELSTHNVISWTSLVAGYAKYGFGEEALNCLDQMETRGLSPDAITFVWVLKACVSVGAINKGKELHTEIARMGFLETDTVLGSMLVEMYAKCGSVAKAREVFCMLPNRDVIAWNALVSAYACFGHAEEALTCLEQMRMDRVAPDTVTFIFCLKSCGGSGAIDKGREIHDQIAREGLLDRDISIGNALIAMYAENGSLEEALELLDVLPGRDIISWNILIAGYSKHERNEEAITCYDQIHLEGICENSTTFVLVLKSIGTVGAIHRGREVHLKILKKGIEGELFIGNALIYMYAKCGCIQEAQNVFKELQDRDIVSWTALMSGYSDLGESELVIDTFNEMRREIGNPDSVSFISLLNVCSQNGLVDKGQMYFDILRKESGLTPTLQHHTCMIDLLGRAGYLERMEMMINEPLLNPDQVLWQTALDACRKWGNMGLGSKCFEQIMHDYERVEN